MKVKQKNKSQAQNVNLKLMNLGGRKEMFNIHIDP